MRTSSRARRVLAQRTNLVPRTVNLYGLPDAATLAPVVDPSSTRRGVSGVACYSDFRSFRQGRFFTAFWRPFRRSNGEERATKIAMTGNW